MKKLSVAAIVLSLMSAAPIYQAQAATPNTGTQTISRADQAKVNQIVAELQAAASAGDEALVTSLLTSAVKNNPTLATNIVSSFTTAQAASAKAGKTTVNVANIINNVVASLGNTPAAQQLAAAVFSGYSTAAGSATPPGAQGAQADQGGKPEAQDTNKAGGDGAAGLIPAENESQTSPTNNQQ